MISKLFNLPMVFQSRSCIAWLLITYFLVPVYGTNVEAEELVPTSLSHSQDWPGWRGPLANNHAIGQSLPLHWNASTAIWRTEIAGVGHASPCILGQQVFLASADEATETQFLISLDRQTGEQLWQTELCKGSLPTIHANNSHASATPVSNGRFVFHACVNSGYLKLFAVDFQGHIQWQHDVVRFEHANGFASSPLIYRDSVIVASENTHQPTIAAFDQTTGSLQWQIPRPSSDNSASPIVAHVAGRDQLLINGAYKVSSYDPLSGAKLWEVKHETEVVACTMTFDENNVYASGKVPVPNLLCVRADGEGDVTDSHVLWQTTKAICYVPSPLVVGDWLFIVTDAGIAYCRNKMTGEIIWKQRLAGEFFSSPVFADGKIYATSKSGLTFVFRAADEFDLLSQNDIGEECVTTPAISGRSIYLRTSKHLYCLSKPES